MNKKIRDLIKEKILKEGMTLDQSIEYIFELKGGKNEDEKRNRKT